MAKIVDIALETPIERGEQKIETLQLRKPSSGELRGLSLTQLLAMNVDELIRLVPRISMPPITEAEVEALDPADLTSCAIEVADFLMPAGKKPTPAT
ncbi:MAG: phage tail assembly protein [Sphingomonas sp.]|nr:phage tail assembly protein [Sphingomonas sp.]